MIQRPTQNTEVMNKCFTCVTPVQQVNVPHLFCFSSFLFLIMFLRFLGSDQVGFLFDHFYYIIKVYIFFKTFFLKINNICQFETISFLRKLFSVFEDGLFFKFPFFIYKKIYSNVYILNKSPFCSDVFFI